VAVCQSQICNASRFLCFRFLEALTHGTIPSRLPLRDRRLPVNNQRALVTPALARPLWATDRSGFSRVIWWQAKNLGRHEWEV
jgi:hypothetical protein